MTILKVATYNLQSTRPNQSDKQARLLRREGVDICALQEINYNNYRFSRDLFNSLNGFEHGDNKFSYCYFGKAIEFAEGSMGIAAVSNYKINNTRTIKLYSEDAMPEAIQKMHYYYNLYNYNKEETIKEFNDFNEKYKYIEPRIATNILCEIGGKTVSFYSTHLSFETKELRHAQLVQLRDILLNDKSDYKILAGDLNVDQSTKELEFLTDKFTIVNGNNGYWIDTFVGIDPNMNVNSVDNIILSKNIKINNTYKIDSDLSDHLPLIAEIELL
ncbi:endonuclease/exonuclease/phosphatase family protein [Bombilactobacillus bombi]|uniref:endonuclease/exonuclease/phosphatase family protein n=1 Tax=Bombilactobacillus bombi TaxID=1303590 RepID=UPI0015E5D8AA|nr:endonuclease/exonuclease/phosphatase family protein [Bombilactobacillus bombi]MBA1435225.1 endonuclease [Bombilactobacillus bombi]